MGGAFKYFSFSPLFGEDFHFDSYFSIGLVQPPTRKPPYFSQPKRRAVVVRNDPFQTPSAWRYLKTPRNGEGYVGSGVAWSEGWGRNCVDAPQCFFGIYIYINMFIQDIYLKGEVLIYILVFRKIFDKVYDYIIYTCDFVMDLLSFVICHFGILSPSGGCLRCFIFFAHEDIIVTVYKQESFR